MEDNNKQLFYMDELSGYKVAEDYCDVRGWEVKDAANLTIGKVDDMLVNKKAERVVYLDVEVNGDLIKTGNKTYSTPASDGVHEFLNKDGDDHLIIPIGLANLDEENKYVLCDQIQYSTFSKAGRFKKGSSISREYEIKTIQHFIPNTNVMADHNRITDSFYNGKEFEYTFKRRQHY
ncbi:MAG: PRC-barrel domain-containing protein [Bacteroidota bacterium]|nr:PRC-barrel domain-containing protein [Bacteroidota bacterium]